MCTLFVRGILDRYAIEHSEEYPVSEKGEIDALSRFVDVPDDDLATHYFATYTTRADQQRHFEEHGTLSADLCPYRYVQGLRATDPRDLVMLYSKAPTRWSNHVRPERTTGWVVLGPTSHYEGHGADWEDTAAFRARLATTLRFLAEEERPLWQATTAAHRELLDRLGESR